jgi:hypothetical protein
MRRVPHGEKISLKGWSFGFGSLDEVVQLGVGDFIEAALKDDEPHASLDWVWGPKDDGIGGPAVSQPDTIRFSMGIFSENFDTGPVWETTVTELAERFVDTLTEGGDPEGAIAPDARERVETLRDKLRQIADYLDSALVRPSKFTVHDA